MGKRLKTLLAALLLSFSTLFTASCTGGSTITGIKMSNEEVVDVPFGNFSYDGIKVTVLFDNGGNREIDLTEEMISEPEQLKFFKMGEQNIIVTFRDTFSTTMKINVVLNEFNDVYELVGYTCMYDGKPHEVKLNHELPEGASIVYPKGNIFTNAGTYDITGVITKSGYATKTLNATLTILENQHDEDGIVFADKTVPFNGETQTIVAENVPEGVTVSYTLYDATKTTRLNKAYNAGTYCFVAHFTNADPNYKQIEDKEAYLTITKIDYDLSNIKFLNVMKFYDGQSYVPSILNKESLPQGLFVHYEIYDEDGNPVNDNSPSGVYTMKAVFTGGDNNHNPITPMEATLTVAKKIIYIKDTLDFHGYEHTFTGTAIFVSNPTGLPDGVNFSLDQNGFTYVGEYPVVATFTAVDPNERVDLESMTVYAIIQPATTSIRVFDGFTDDPEPEPLYHNFTLKDIDIDFDNNTASVNTDKLRLGEDFENVECGIAIDEENPITFEHIYTDPSTGEESYIPTEVKDLTVGETYKFSVGFRLTNADPEVEAKLNESLSISSMVGTFKYGYVNTRSGEYEYQGSFNASNIYIKDNKAYINNVETGVTAKEIKFFDPTTSLEVSASELTIGNTYNYEVCFDQQESFVYVNETGAFTYKKVGADDGTGHYVNQFDTHNLLVINGAATTYEVEPGVDVELISLVDKDDESAVAIGDIVVGHTFDYVVNFTGKSEVGSTPGIIYRQESGSFTYDRVKDLDTNQPITANNISIAADEASIINIDPSIKVNYIKFYTGASEVPVADLVAGQSYNYEVSFASDDSTVYMVETGTLKVGGPVMGLGTGSEYDTPFSISNLLIAREGVAEGDFIAKVIDINPENHVRFIKFYDNNGVEVTDLSNITVDNSYSYKVFFANDNGYNWQTAKGEFDFIRIKNEAGTAVFYAYDNLRFKDGNAYLIDVTEGIEVISIKIYEQGSKNEVTDLTDMVPGNFYYYRITIRSNNGLMYKEEMSNFPYESHYIGA